jgi:predicted DNA-binding protein
MSSVRIPFETMERLKGLKRRSGFAVARLIALAVRSYVKKNSKKRALLIPARTIDSGGAQKGLGSPFPINLEPALEAGIETLTKRFPLTRSEIIKLAIEDLSAKELRTGILSVHSRNENKTA